MRLYNSVNSVLCILFIFRHTRSFLCLRLVLDLLVFGPRLGLNICQLHFKDSVSFGHSSLFFCFVLFFIHWQISNISCKKKAPAMVDKTNLTPKKNKWYVELVQKTHSGLIISKSMVLIQTSHDTVLTWTRASLV